MTYLARELIADAYYLSAIVSKSFQTVSGEQESSGLRLLNVVLGNKASDKRLIPYFSQYTVNAVIGQEQYFIPHLIEPETFTFNIGPIRYQTSKTARNAYFGSARADNVKALPLRWHTERTLGGSNLFVYFLPTGVYVFKIWGKFSLDDVAVNTDLSTLFDTYYTNYLTYELAQYICDSYGVPLPPNVATNLIALRERTRDESPIDLSVRKNSRFSRQFGLNYGQINLGQGWTPFNSM